MGWTGQTRQIMWTGQKYWPVLVKMTSFYATLAFVFCFNSFMDMCTDILGARLNEGNPIRVALLGDF